MSFLPAAPSGSAVAVNQTGACSPSIEVEAVHSGLTGVICSLTVTIGASVGDDVGLITVEAALGAAVSLAVTPPEHLEVVGGQEALVSDNLGEVEGRRI